MSSHELTPLSPPPALPSKARPAGGHGEARPRRDARGEDGGAGSGTPPTKPLALGSTFGDPTGSALADGSAPAYDSPGLYSAQPPAVDANLTPSSRRRQAAKAVADDATATKDAQELFDVFVSAVQSNQSTRGLR